MKIRINNRTEIGDGCETYIIAEVGSNFRDKIDCLNSISQAKLCGASAVKFQLYTHESLYGFPGEMSGVLDPMWIPGLKEKADAVGIDFLCTPFSVAAIELLNPYVDVFKVASSEMCHKRMLEKLRSIGKPVILSTGAQTEPDIGWALDQLGDTPVVLLYCVAAYPANEINLDVIRLMKDRFWKPVGFSDHSVDVGFIPRAAIDHGAVVIEKHVTFIEAATPDSPHSLNGDQFKKMVNVIRNGPQAAIGPTASERGMILRHKRRIIATKDLDAGTVLVEGENFGIFRALSDDTDGAHPALIDKMNGMRVREKIQAGEGISPSDLE